MLHLYNLKAITLLSICHIIEGDAQYKQIANEMLWNLLMGERESPLIFHSVSKLSIEHQSQPLIMLLTRK